MKRLSGNSKQADVEFKNEMLLVAKLQHRCLVNFKGFLWEGRERILIYELLGNGRLDRYIFGMIRKKNVIFSMAFICCKNASILLSSISL